MSTKEKAYSREREIVRTSIIGILANVFLSAFKALVGIFANAISIILDAVNNLSDAVSSIITIIGMKLAAKPADKKHPYGHGRYENLTAMIIAAIVISAGVSAFVESIKKIANPAESNFSVISLVIIAVAIAVKIFLGLFFKRVGKKTNSDPLKNSGSDALFDAVVSTATLISPIIYFIWPQITFPIDGVLGILISIVIIRSGIMMLIESINEVLGLRVDSSFSKNIKKDIASFDGIYGAYDLILHNYGPNIMIGSVHVEVDGKLLAKDIHALTLRIQREIMKKYGIFLTIGIYADDTDDADVLEIKNVIRNETFKHESVLQTHAIFVDKVNKIISFDIVMDFDEKEPVKVKEAIIEALESELEGYSCEINIDKDYSD